MRKKFPSVHSSHGNGAPGQTLESLHLVAKTSPPGTTLQKPLPTWRFLRAAAGIVRAVEGIPGLTIGDPIGTPLCMTFPLFSPRATGEMFARSGLYQRVAAAAHDLEANVMRPEPLRHAALLRDISLIKLLKMSAHYYDAVTAVLVDQDGEHPIPVLSSQCFDEPTEDRTGEFSGLKQVTGVDLDKSNRRTILRLNHGSVFALMTPEIAEEMRSLTIAGLEKGLRIEGQWLRTEGGEWQTQPGAKLVFQREITFVDANADEPEVPG